MIYAATTNLSRQSDKAAIDGGIEETLLMRRAADGLFLFLKEKGLLKGKIAIVCGNGNNGGDGFALADILLKNGFSPKVFCFDGKRSKDADYYYNIIYNIADITIYNNSESLDGFDLIVDAMFGTGLNKPIEGDFLAAVDAINQSEATVVSADIASGLNGDNGRVCSRAVKADYTVTFCSPKVGHYLSDGRDFGGELHVVDIGIKLLSNDVSVSEITDLKAAFLGLKNNIHKGTSGSVGIIGGSKNFVGAPYLAYLGESALRVGAGLNYLAFPECLYQGLSGRITEGIMRPVKMDGEQMAFDEQMLSDFKELSAVVFGVGLGKFKRTNEAVSILLSGRAKLALDADGLNTLDFENFDGQNKTVITPHPKELSRLLGVSMQDILDNPVEIAANTAKKHNCVVLLKGATTVVSNGKTTVLNTFGSPAQAKGGSGDLLAGIIGGLLARGIDAFSAAYIGAGIAGLAAELAAADNNPYSVLPSDTAAYIRIAINKILKS